MRERAEVVISVIIAVSCVTCGFGCSQWFERRALDATVAIVVRSRAATSQESDVQLARAAIPGAIKTLEGMYVAYPDHEGIVELLAEATCQYAIGFIQDDWEQRALMGDDKSADEARYRARNLLARCVNYGLIMLGMSWATAYWQQNPGFEALVAHAGTSEVAGMFWVALATAAIIQMYPEEVSLGAYLPMIERLFLRVIEIDSNYQQGLPQLSLAVLQTTRSAMQGENIHFAQQMFAQAREQTGGRGLMVEVLFARYYAVLARDRELFISTLVRVIQTDPAIWPEQRLANELAQRKARRYLRYSDRWF